jgi:hypothetical protein
VASVTFEERLHSVVQLLEATATLALRNEQAIQKVVELQEVQSRSLGKLIETVDILGTKLITLNEQVSAYVADSRERMKQMEANLDALIRIITAEHSNGKGKL